MYALTVRPEVKSSSFYDACAILDIVTRCPKCGSPLSGKACKRCADKGIFRVFNREMLLLVVLSGITIPLFLFTRSMAARNRAMNVEIATTWYEQGRHQLQAGQIPQAIQSFRNATTNDHDNDKYSLALAEALSAANDIEEARQALLRLRSSSPENGEINLDLARLAARQARVPEAVRYYRNALYGVWPPEQMAGQPLRVRTELVRFLLSTGDESQALSELLILSSDIPDNAQAHDNIGGLFLEAGDSQHAMQQFERALRLDGKDTLALSGAGRATFQVGDYNRARRYLEAAIANGVSSNELSDLLETTRLVLSRDPLAPGLGAAERIRRISVDLASVENELQTCIGRRQDDPKSQLVLNPLLSELMDGLQGPFRPAELRSDAEGFRVGLDLIGRIETAIREVCSDSSPLHNALSRIAKKHGVSEQ